MSPSARRQIGSKMAIPIAFVLITAGAYYAGSTSSVRSSARRASPSNTAAHVGEPERNVNSTAPTRDPAVERSLFALTQKVAVLEAESDDRHAQERRTDPFQASAALGKREAERLNNFNIRLNSEKTDPEWEQEVSSTVREAALQWKGSTFRSARCATSVCVIEVGHTPEAEREDFGRTFLDGSPPHSQLWGRPATAADGTSITTIYLVRQGHSLTKAERTSH